MRSRPRCAWIFALAALSLGACYPKGWVPDLSVDYVRPGESLFLAGPYLIQLRQGVMAVVLEHNLPQAPEVYWKTATASVGATVKAVAFDGLWVAVLEDLPIDQPLTYSVISTIGSVGPLPFRAGRTRGESFRFAAYGDTRTGHRVHRDLIDALAPENVDFVIHSGDMVESGGKEDQWRLFIRLESPVIAKAPIFGSIGNHDSSPRLYFERYFLTELVASGNRYYYQDFGDVRVVNLDSEVELRRGSAQYRFAETALREGAQKNQLMLISLHYPPYSSGAHGSNLEMREVLGELAPRFGVEVVLAGHDHNYERTKRIDGVTYIVAASAGANIRKLSPSWFSEVVRTEPHFVLFDVERGSLVGRTVNLTGDVFDSFVIPANPPREALGAAP